MKWLAVFVGGGMGALFRYAVSSIWLTPHSLGFPWGTLVVNATGSFALGFLGLYFASPSGDNAVFLFITVGLCGGYTTFSTFSLDTFSLVERGMLSRAAAYVLASVALSYAALVVGYILARSLRPSG